MIKKYIDILETIDFQDRELLRFQKLLLEYDHAQLTEDIFAWISCVLALKAASLGNMGVGAILVENNQVIYEASNEMFNPYYRTDGHPEMMVLTEFEISRADNMNSITMYSSLEPCPMCLTRLSTTGIGEVRYIASHPDSGMAQSIDKLPAHWRQYCEDLVIKESSCSTSLKELSLELINETTCRLIPKILHRKGS